MVWGLEGCIAGICVSTDQGWLHRGVTWVVTQGLAPKKAPCLVLCFAMGCLKFMFFWFSFLFF